MDSNEIFIDIGHYHGHEVMLQTKVIPDVASQIWKKENAYENGWFTLKNPISGLMLKSNPSSEKLIIDGKFILITTSFCS